MCWLIEQKALVLCLTGSHDLTSVLMVILTLRLTLNSNNLKGTRPTTSKLFTMLRYTNTHVQRNTHVHTHTHTHTCLHVQIHSHPSPPHTHTHTHSSVSWDSCHLYKCMILQIFNVVSAPLPTIMKIFPYGLKKQNTLLSAHYKEKEPQIKSCFSFPVHKLLHVWL